MPPGEAEAIGILQGVKAQYEKFHGVAITDEAVEAAVAASRFFLRYRHLPDRAIDLIDDAAARVKLRRGTEPREMAEIRKRIRLITMQMENAIANYEFSKARLHSEQESQERKILERLQEERKLTPPGNTVTAEDVIEAVANRAGVAVSAVQSVLARKDAAPLERAAKELSSRIPGAPPWLDGLAAHLAGCSAEEAERLVEAIRSMKKPGDKENPEGSGQA